MALTFFDGFDMYDGTTSTAQQRGWTTTGITYNQTGRFTGSKAVSFSANTQNMAWTLAAAIASLSVGFAFKVDTAALAGASTGVPVIAFYNGATLQAQLGYTTNGAIVTGRGDFVANQIAISANSLIIAAAWNYIEIEFTRHASTGVFKVYLNGVLVAALNSTGVNTGSLDINKIFFAGTGNGTTSTVFDDFYVTNTATRLGERRVEYLPVSVDTATKDWTASTGTNHAALLDEIPSNGDTDYISDSVVGHKDLFDVTDLSSTPTNIDAVQVVMIARKDDATTRQIRHNMKNGATTTNGTTQTMAATYSTFSDLYLTNPNTAAAWTASDVNATQAGVEVVT